MLSNGPRAIFPFQDEIILEDERVLLRPLHEEDTQELYSYVLSEPELFTYALRPMGSRSDLEYYIEQALIQREQGLEYPFVVIDKESGLVAGTTRFYLINSTHLWLAIGYTWIGKRFQRTGLNRSMKELMLKFSFQQLGFHRVEFRVDSENTRSIKSLESIGARVEGELRDHMYRGDGSRRNTIILSLIQSDFGYTRK